MCPHRSTCNQGRNCDCAHRQRVAERTALYAISDEIQAGRTRQPEPPAQRHARARRALAWLARAEAGWDILHFVSPLILVGLLVAMALGWLP